MAPNLAVEVRPDAQRPRRYAGAVAWDLAGCQVDRRPELSERVVPGRRLTWSVAADRVVTGRPL